MLGHEKNCSNPNTIDEQLQLVVLFVPPQVDQFNYFFFDLSPLPNMVGGVFFQKTLMQYLNCLGF
jgi:hypothetical protein